MQANLQQSKPTVLIPSISRYADAAIILAASLFIALLSQAAVRLPFSPVPITGQTFAILLVGAALGSKRGGLAVTAYLAEGLIGLPVFAAGGAGFAHLLGPTGGYLLGFVAMAWVIGWFAEHSRERRVRTAWLVFLAAEIVLYALGLPWLAVYIGADKALALGLLPFIPGDLLKIFLAGLALPAAWKLIPNE
jgi:biotin transport system substrate-specific component